MIKVIEKEFLNDNFIDKNFVQNVDISKRLNFDKNNIYYFGNYNDEKLKLIQDKLLKNKKSIINAIEKNAKIIVYGNSCELFNNRFKNTSLNLFTNCYNNSRRKKINPKERRIYHVDSLENAISCPNFKYKNFLFIDCKKTK